MFGTGHLSLHSNIPLYSFFEKKETSLHIIRYNIFFPTPTITKLKKYISFKFSWGQHLKLIAWVRQMHLLKKKYCRELINI